MDERAQRILKDWLAGLDDERRASLYLLLDEL